MNTNRIIYIITILTLILSCSNNKKEVSATSSYYDVTKDSIPNSFDVKKDTIENNQVEITSTIHFDDLGNLHLNVNNTSQNEIFISEYCLQVSKDKGWETLFCDTLPKIVIHPLQKDEVVIDLRVGQFTYTSEQQYRFLAYQNNNETVLLYKYDFYSLNLIKHPETGKLNFVPESIIED